MDAKVCINVNTYSADETALHVGVRSKTKIWINSKEQWLFNFLGRLLRVHLIKWASNAHPSVCLSVHPHKVSSISMKFGM